MSNIISSSELIESITGNLLKLTFIGEAGNSHEHIDSFEQIDTFIETSGESYEFKFLVLDFTDLVYEWGDEMGRTLDLAACTASEDDLLLRIIVSDKNKAGLTSLIEMELLEEPKNWLCESLESAISALSNHA